MVSKSDIQLSFVGQPAPTDPSPEYGFLLFPRPLAEPPPETKAAPPPPEVPFPLPPLVAGEAVLLGSGGEPLAVETAGGEPPSVETAGEPLAVETAGGEPPSVETAGEPLGAATPEAEMLVAETLGCAPLPGSTAAFKFPAELSMPPGEAVLVGLELGLLATVLLATPSGG